MSITRGASLKNAIEHLKMASEILNDVDYDYDIVDCLDGLVEYIENHEDEEASSAKAYGQEED